MAHEDQAASEQEDRTNTQAGQRSKRERHRAVPLLPEVRFWNGTVVEIREDSSTGEVVLSGTPIVYDVDYVVTDMFGQFTERMAPTVADAVLSRGVDCRFLFNHDGLPLARTAAGTMTLENTSTALQMVVRLDPRQGLANDLRVAIERGDVSEMSCGFIVAQDEWNEDFDDRTIRSFADLLDVSAVTYAASPTTHIDVAHRMAMDIPVESRARIRKIATDLRAGKMLSTANAAKIAQAHEALNTVLLAAGIGQDEPEAPDETPDTDPVVEQHDDGAVDDASSASVAPDNSDGAGSADRSAPATAAERRDQSLSFGDQQSAVYEALCEHLGGAGVDVDIWICDCASDWVVWEAFWGEGGQWRIAYAVDDAGAITFNGAPECVERVTSYQPVDADEARSEDVPKTSRAVHIRAQARKLGVL